MIAQSGLKIDLREGFSDSAKLVREMRENVASGCIFCSGSPLLLSPSVAMQAVDLARASP